MTTTILRRGLATTIMTIALGLTAMAQTPAPVVFGIGTGMTDPQGTLHVHSSELIENLEPLIPIGDGWRNDPIPENEPDHYQTLLHMTNTTTGATKNDGFTLKQYDNQLTFIQHEQSSMRFENPAGSFELNAYGNVGVGASHQNHRFNVEGTSRFTGAVTMQSSLTVGSGMRCDAQGNMKVKRLRVTLTDWPDYVFGEGYRLRPLAEVEEYVKEHSHLPDVPSAEEVEQDGADLGEMNRLLLQKVEELTLYIIDLQKQLNELKSNR